ncbi:hypothetical protein N7495_009956 [Penicillium taxi]|uniref:uncharacterized protein n=1 Tax=Penicillium taxi TaxID=168475 RepID=UPI0025451D68|nr:uncharacterized protein N7495_009956 [Penicillium taxi]KAJ5885446.1 hypothetical protein N7495_009956 [Penicillium taxi]
MANNDGNNNPDTENNFIDLTTQAGDEVGEDTNQQVTSLEGQFAGINIIDLTSPEATEPITGLGNRVEEEVIRTDTSENFIDSPRRVSDVEVQKISDKQRRPRKFSHTERRRSEPENPEPESDSDDFEKITKARNNKPVEKVSEPSSASRRTGNKLKAKEAKAQPKLDLLEVPYDAQQGELNEALVNKRNIGWLDE